MLPGLELPAADIERRPLELTQQHVPLADAKLAAGEAHRRAPVAAPARLVEEQRAVLRHQLAQHGRGRVGHRDAGHLH